MEISGKESVLIVSGTSLILHQNLTSGSFLKVSCNVESKNNQWTFYTVVLNRLVYLQLSMDPWPMHGFVTFCTGHFENMGLLSYADPLPNVDLFYNIKNHSC